MAYAELNYIQRDNKVEFDNLGDIQYRRNGVETAIVYVKGVCQGFIQLHTSLEGPKATHFFLNGIKVLLTDITIRP